MLSHKTLNQPLSSPRHSDEAPPARPRAVSEDEKPQEQARPTTPPPPDAAASKSTPPPPPLPIVSPSLAPNRKRGRQWASLDESDDDDDDD